jgi:hypothetical protein
MDRINEAVFRFWGPLDEGGHLHRSPCFAAELAERCTGQLGLQEVGVSKWSLGKHLEHLYRSSHYVLDRLDESMAGLNPSGRMSIYGRGLMIGGFIPRGVFRTIPPLEPVSGNIDDIEPLRQRLAFRLERLQWDLDQIKSSSGRSLHPRMKYLSASEWLFFADVHHRHHLAIIRDILKTAA